MDDVLLGRARKYDGSSDEERDEDEVADGLEDTKTDSTQRYDTNLALGGAKVRTFWLVIIHARIGCACLLFQF